MTNSEPIQQSMPWSRRITVLRRQTEQVMTTVGILVSELADLERTVGEYETRPAEEKQFIELATAAVCKQYGVESYRLFSKQRPQQVCAARHMLYYLLYEHTSLSFPQIGLLLGRDHASVIHGHNLISARAGREPLFSKQIQKLLDTINSQIKAAIKETYAKPNHDTGRSGSVPAGAPDHGLPVGQTQANPGIQDRQRLAV